MICLSIEFGKDLHLKQWERVPTLLYFECLDPHKYQVSELELWLQGIWQWQNHRLKMKLFCLISNCMYLTHNWICWTKWTGVVPVRTRLLIATLASSLTRGESWWTSAMRLGPNPPRSARASWVLSVQQCYKYEISIIKSWKKARKITCVRLIK